MCEEHFNKAMKAEILNEFKGWGFRIEAKEIQNKRGSDPYCSFDISWEDGNGLSSASMPPNEIAWAENKETYCAGCKAAESGCHCAEVYGADNLADYEPIDSVEVDRTSYQPTQDYGSEFEGEFTDNMKKGAAYGMGGYAGFVGFGLIASSVVLALELIGRKMGE